MELNESTNSAINTYVDFHSPNSTRPALTTSSPPLSYSRVRSHGIEIHNAVAHHSPGLDDSHQRQLSLVIQEESNVPIPVNIAGPSTESPTESGAHVNVDGSSSHVDANVGAGGDSATSATSHDGLETRPHRRSIINGAHPYRRPSKACTLKTTSCEPPNKFQRGPRIWNVPVPGSAPPSRPVVKQATYHIEGKPLDR